MPRKLELSFQRGSGGRRGRWKKRYRGKTHYLGSGRSKSDAASYQGALATWRRLKVKLDAEAAPEPRPHDQAYAEVIGEWELVLSWSATHGHDEDAARAREKLAELRKRRDRPKPPPVTPADRLWSRFRVDDELVRAIGDLADLSSTGHAEFREAMLARAEVFRAVGSVEARPWDDVHPLRRAEIQWQDRLESQKSIAAAHDNQTLGGWVQTYLARQQQRVDAGDLSPGRFVAGQAALTHFRDWAGAQTDVASISGQTLTRFHAHQLQLIAAKHCAPAYARDRMSAVRSFIRWLWGQDAIKDLPKNIDSRELTISKRTTTPETFTIDEVQQLLRVAADRTRLYVLLALNCGMTQKDISDLAQDDVSWSSAKIRRKRSKTRKYQGVPIVTYQLWPETFALLEASRSDSDHVLVNRHGTPLVVEAVTADGSYSKTDNVKNAYERARRKVSLTKPFKALRKASATLISAHEQFRGLEQLFLGHAPDTVAARHYTATSEQALDSALTYLRATYGIEQLFAP